MTLRPDTTPCTIGDVCDFESGNGFRPQEWKASLKVHKRGLVQKLLTGQWRIPIPETHEVLADG